MALNDTQPNIPDVNLSDIIDFFEHLRTNTSPYIKIVEQPASKGLRFRYECEGRSAGSIPGVNSTADNKTYPTIQIVGYKGRAVVVVSCVTKDRPYRPHPHNLVGRDNCKKGICTIDINNESMEASLQNLGIQCVKRKDIEEALKVREDIRVDPFGTGFSHKENPTSIDFNAVRLCFQAFLKDEKGNIRSILKPIVSDPIYDKKAMSDLSICKLSDAAASVVGDKEIILLCEKVTKDDIQVRFFEEKDGKCIWEDYGVFKAQDVHKQVAISFKTPKYKTTEIDNPVTVWIQLKRPSDGMCSDALPFTFTPDSDPVMSKRKRQKLLSESELLIQLPSNPIRHIDQSSNFIDGMVDQSSISVSNEEEPEPSPNPLSGPLPHSSVLQHLPPYNSTPSTSKYPLPNEKYIISQTKFPNPNIRLNTTGHNIDQSSNFIDGMVDQSSISVSNEEEPEPSPNPLSGIHPLPHSSVLQHLLSYNSTPSTSKYLLPNENYNSSQTTFLNTDIRLNTTAWPTDYSHYPTDYAPTHLPCPTEGNNESNLMEATFPSPDFIDIGIYLREMDHALSTNFSASLHLTENSVHEDSNPEILVQDNINMSDSLDELFEI